MRQTRKTSLAGEILSALIVILPIAFVLSLEVGL